MRAKIEITSTLYNSAKRTGYHRNTVKISMLPSAAINSNSNYTKQHYNQPRSQALSYDTPWGVIGESLGTRLHYNSHSYIDLVPFKASKYRLKHEEFEQVFSTLRM